MRRLPEDGLKHRLFDARDGLEYVGPTSSDRSARWPGRRFLNAAPDFESTSAFASAAIGMALVAFDGRFLRVNPAFCKLLGRSSEELLATSWPAISHPDDVSVGIDHAHAMAAGTEETFQLAKRYLRPDGGIVWAMLNVSLIRTASGEPARMFTQVSDMTAYLEAQDDRDRLAVIADASDDAIIGTDIDGVISAWNRGAQSIFGYSGPEAVGRHISLLIPDDRRAELDRHLKSALKVNQVSRAEMVCIPMHGPPIEVAATLSPIPGGGGRVTGVSFVARDITEQRWLARTLDSTLGALEEALQQAWESEERSRRFLADAAHQLRTPIAGIQACAETLLRDPPKEELDHLLTHLLRETSRASRLMGSLLRMARLDQGENVDRKPCNLAALCADEADRAQTLAPDLEITSRVVAMDDDRPAVDAHAVREIVANLLDNARRYAASKVEVVVGESDGLVRIEVVDDGPGLSADLVDRAFERFVSLDHKAGSGLGLPIARELARAHGGDLRYENKRFVTLLVSVPSASPRPADPRV